MKESLFEGLSEEEREIAEYGLYQGGVLLGGVLVALALGFLMGILGETVLFLIVTYFLRIYAGGYHAKTQLRCGIFSFICTLIFFLMIKYHIFSGVILHAVSAVSAALIVAFSPVGCPNKRLDDAEKRHYGRKAKIIVLAECVVYLVLSIFSLQTCCRIIGLSWLFVALFVMLGKINDRLKNEGNNI